MVPLMQAQVQELNLRYPFRQQQIQQLSCLLSPLIPSPPSLIVHGTEATCKTSIVKTLLESSGLLHAIIQCKECITGRHLLERTISACLDALETSSGQPIDQSRCVRTENLSALTVHLQTLLAGTAKFVLVFDGVDEQREAPHTLLPALARLSEIMPNLVVVFIVSFARQRLLHTSGTPHIHFPSYNRSEAIHILSLSPPRIYQDELPADYTTEQHTEDANWLWPRFCAAVWDSLAKNTARDVLSFRSLADKLWPPFTASIVDGMHQPREFSKILVARRALFQNEDTLIERVVPKSTTTSDSRILKPSHDLPYYSKYLLCAAYLASHNPSRTDPLHFSRFASTKRKRTRNPSTTATSKARSTLTSTANTTLTNPSNSRNRKIPRRLLAASPFPLERLLAIFHAIVPNRAPTTADVYGQVATLTGLRLLVRGGTAAGTGGDAVDAGARWRVNVGWEYALTVGRSVGFEMEEFVAE